MASMIPTKLSLYARLLLYFVTLVSPRQKDTSMTIVSFTPQLSARLLAELFDHTGRLILFNGLRVRLSFHFY